MGFKSAHTLINKERVRRGRSALKRSVSLDQLCRQHAQTLASHQQLGHIVNTIDELKVLLQTSCCAENIQRGPSVIEMHKESMSAKGPAYKNILSKNFLEFGVGTAIDADTKLYMVQLFRGADAVVVAQQQETTDQQSSSSVPGLQLPALQLSEEQEQH